jgi:hypothetical protein
MSLKRYFKVMLHLGACSDRTFKQHTRLKMLAVEEHYNLFFSQVNVKDLIICKIDTRSTVGTVPML